MKLNMSTVGVRKKRKKCLNRKASQGNEKATVQLPAWGGGMPGFHKPMEYEGILNYCENALITSILVFFERFL